MIRAALYARYSSGPAERGLDRGPVPDLPGPRRAGGLDAG